MWFTPVLMLAPPVNPKTVNGPGCREASPSWPYPFVPQHFVVPSPSSAQVKASPALTPTALVMPVACTGVVGLLSG